MGSKAQRSVVDRQEGRLRTRPRVDLPVQASSFVGRERELDELEGMLASSRLLTLTGPGGCGKTRLALEAAANLAEDFEDGVGLVELAPLSSPELVAEGAARALKVRWGAGLSPAEALLEYLEPKEMLLLLDNCEHLIEACAGLVDDLLRSCPGLKILATRDAVQREAQGRDQSPLHPQLPR
jgi:predicted ATPase